MSWLYSRALVEAYSGANSLDGEPSAPLKSNPTQQAFLSPDRMTAFSRLSRFGMTFAPLMEDLGADVLTWFLAGFPARTYRQPEGARELTEPGRAFGRKCGELLAKFDPDLSSWKTLQRSLLEERFELLEKWPQWATWDQTECLAQKTPFGILEIRQRITNANDSGFVLRIPTPTVCGNYNRKGASKTSGDGFATFCKRYPTPQASDNRDRGNLNSPAVKRRAEIGKQLSLGMILGGAPNPQYAEWLMGWPLGWTDLKPLGTDKFRQWWNSHGKP